MTVEEMLTRMSSRELTEWMAYAQLEPFGEARGDLRAGIVASTIANANRDAKKQPHPYTPHQFMPLVEEPEPDAEMVASKALAAFGGGD